MKLIANRIAGIIRERGHKLTPQRHAVFKVIAATHDHLTPEAIYEKAHAENPELGVVTVYRTLDLHSELNLVCRIHGADGCRGYMMRRPTDHHHHLVCTKYGRVVDFTACVLNVLEKKLSGETGFGVPFGGAGGINR